MANLKDLRIRIKSVKSTQKITSAMKMVAAAKLRRAQEAAEAARPYAQRMERMIASLGAKVSGVGGPKLIAGTGRDDVHMIVVRSEEHTSELQSLMRISYAVFCLKKKTKTQKTISQVHK